MSSGTESSVLRKAAALIIGNEILSGKVRDENIHVLGKFLWDHGTVLRRVVVCPDDEQLIASEIRELSEHHDFVFTSGGVGPTHDDVTISAIAEAFGVPVEIVDELDRMLRKHFGDRYSKEHQNLAKVPKGARLLSSDKMPWPILCFRNIFILPGIPSLFEKRLSLLHDHFSGQPPLLSEEVSLQVEEVEIAAVLRELAVAHPEVNIGSYPFWREKVAWVRITIDGRDLAAVSRVFSEIKARLPSV